MGSAPQAHYPSSKILNHLAIRAINAPGVQLGYADPEKGFPLTAFPSASSPRLGGYSFETLADFENILVARMPQKTA